MTGWVGFAGKMTAWGGKGGLAGDFPERHGQMTFTAARAAPFNWRLPEKTANMKKITAKGRWKSEDGKTTR